MIRLITRLTRRQEPTVKIKVGGSQSLGVNIGDRFYKVGYGEAVWVVERRFKPACESHPHVVLSRHDFENDKRVVSEMILLDKSHYRRDRREAPYGVKFPHRLRRRRNDDPRDLAPEPDKQAT